MVQVRDRLEFEFTGFEEFAERVAKYKAKVRDEIAQRTVQAGFNIQREARLEVPVDHGVLKNSIKSYFFNRNLSAEIVAEARYAPYVEYGTGSLVDVPQELTESALRFKRGGNRNMKARPFLWPAEHAERAEYLKDINNIVLTEWKSHHAK